MRVLLTGGTGFVGRYVLQQLLSRGHQPHVLVRRLPSPPPPLHTLGHAAGRLGHTPDPPADGPCPVFFVGDLTSPALKDAASGCQAAIHLVGIIRETPPHATFRSVHVEGTGSVLEACRDAGIRRFIHMSALGTRPDAVAEYHRTKWEAEELVRNSALDWTIFRPSVIVGPDGEFVQMVRAWAYARAAPWIVFPYFRAGLLGLGRPSLLQPVSVADVARAFVDALDRPQTAAHTYDLVGPHRLTWPAFYRKLAEVYAFPTRPALPIPLWYARLLTTLTPARLLPFNRSQVDMAAEDNVGDAEPFVRDFGYTPAAWAT